MISLLVFLMLVPVVAYVVAALLCHPGSDRGGLMERRGPE